MNLDSIPLFQLLCGIAIVMVLFQTYTARQVDILRWRTDGKWMFLIRRSTMFMKAIALCWAVIYSEQHGWAPWPPIQAFLGAFIAYVGTHIMILRYDLTQLKRIHGVGPRESISS